MRIELRILSGARADHDGMTRSEPQLCKSGAEVTSAAQTNLVSQTQVLQQSESGVNLDEEAANLLRYQQAYQAAGKLIQTAGVLFDTLLAMSR